MDNRESGMAFRIFLHGLESSNQGTKAIFFRERYPDMVTPHFKGDLQERMGTLNRLTAGKKNLRIVGSSFGGLMGTIFTMQNEHLVDRLILLAPAINFLDQSGYQEKRLTLPVWVYHGTDDAVIPLKDIAPLAERYFTQLTFKTVHDDHFLHKTFKTIDWDSLLLE